MNRSGEGVLDGRESRTHVPEVPRPGTAPASARPVDIGHADVRSGRLRPAAPFPFTVLQFGRSYFPYAVKAALENKSAAVRATGRAFRGGRAIKRTFDIVCAAALLLALSPLFAVLALLIKTTSGGPVLYRHPRIGKNGRRFTCFKFRTMVADADDVLKAILAGDARARREWEENFKLKDDPRVLPVGRFLRRTSLDELPQLWNVLRGEMSLVGPRPIVAQEMKRYGRDIGCYLASVPGITGLWQISGRNDLSYGERVTLDRWYARNWCLSLDFRILLSTIRAMVSGRGAY